jgi:hypothetical protein
MDRKYHDERKKAINEALESTPAQISMAMFALECAAKSYDAGYLAARCADPPPAVVRRIEEEFAGRVKARVEQFDDPYGHIPPFYEAMDAELGGKGE